MSKRIRKIFFYSKISFVSVTFSSVAAEAFRLSRRPLLISLFNTNWYKKWLRKRH